MSSPEGSQLGLRYEIKDKRYQNFVNSLKAEVTKFDYSSNLNYYLELNNMTIDELLQLSIHPRC